MHRFRSRRTLFKLRASSLFFLLFVACVLALIPSAVWGFVLYDHRGVQLSIVLLPCVIVCGLAYLFFSAGLRCPLCHGPLLGKPGCVRNPKASRLFRSYRLGVATSSLLLGHFRCPCCGEPCRCSADRR